MFKHIITIGLCCFTITTFAQQNKTTADTLQAKNNLDEVVVTATRSERKLSNVAVPVTIINKKTIQQSGSLRLNDILNEQAGLFITNSFGSGLQMQGLSPDYTLILIDGEPVVGRTSGVLDLSRIAVANIKKIEIVKGPSSSLYGSDAMAGVVNIITENPYQTTYGASLRYGSFGVTDINANAAVIKNKFNLSAQGNFYNNNGYNLNAASPAQTLDPFYNYTLQAKAGYKFSDKTKWTVNARYFNQLQTTNPYKDVDASNNTFVFSGNETTKDVNISNTLEHKFSSAVKSYLRIYYTDYQSATNQSYIYNTPSNNIYYNDYFEQIFTRLENQTDIAITSKSNLIIGGGWIFDNVKSNRYDESIVTKKNNIGYLFSQYDWQINNWWNVIAGVRYDYNQNYASHVSPKLAMQFIPVKKLKINASIGGGFKAPDFRQLYLNFTNTSAGTGYTVLGNNEVVAGMQLLQRQGQIQSVNQVFYNAALQPLQPETSTGINLGFNYTFTKKINLNINFFRNDVNNLITTSPIAQKTNNSFVYSYFNLNKVYTQGFETEIIYKPIKAIQISVGYQLLYTADKHDIDSIKSSAGVYGRDNGVVYRLTLKDYKGLFDRSKHSANIKIYYENKNGWFTNLREIYRSGWGVQDLDGNLLLNRGDLFTKDFFQTNISIGKFFNNGLKVQAGCDNVFNWKDIINSPNIPGALFYAGISYSFTQHKK